MTQIGPGRIWDGGSNGSDRCEQIPVMPVGTVSGYSKGRVDEYELFKAEVRQTDAANVTEAAQPLERGQRRVGFVAEGSAHAVREGREEGEAVNQARHRRTETHVPQPPGQPTGDVIEHYTCNEEEIEKKRDNGCARDQKDN
uniref:Uncharacterized protein n=1 Tax=Anopheles farauti TaxID=69004 RepID=A0A182QH73_9DIPT